MIAELYLPISIFDTYSHLKNLTLMVLQITVITSIMITAGVTSPTGSPSAAFFSIFIPFSIKLL